MDGWDKLKPDGFAGHGSIDGYSHRLDRPNNNPVVIARYYMDAVKEYGGCPLSMKIWTDCGTENGLVAAGQSMPFGDDLAHIYGTSHHNQQINGWWSYLRQNFTSWWINFFKDLLEQQVFTTGNKLQMECLYCGSDSPDCQRIFIYEHYSKREAQI